MRTGDKFCLLFGVFALIFALTGCTFALNFEMTDCHFLGLFLFGAPCTLVFAERARFAFSQPYSMILLDFSSCSVSSILNARSEFW